MLMEVKNQIKVIFLSLKYNIMKHMVNKVTFVSNIVTMILNNASFIVQWLILFSLKEEIGGFTLKEVILLWGMAAVTYGVAHVVFHRVFSLSELIINGKIDTFLVQPKNVFLSVITSETSISAIGDVIYGYICLFIYGISIKNLIMFTLFSITGGVIISAFAGILGSLSFWIVKGDIISDSLISIMIHMATYPDTIFKNSAKVILYTIIPVGLANYMPVNIILNFDVKSFLIVVSFAVAITAVAFLVFNKGLKRYSSSNLMGARI